MTPQCKNHPDEYCVEGPTSEYPNTAHCPDCQRKLAEAWTKLFGWECITKVSKRGTHKYWAKDNVFQSDDTDLISTILSPDGMVKAWEMAKKAGWMHCTDSGDDFGFCREVCGWAGAKWDFTKLYDFDEYGKVIAIMLAAWEALEAVKNG